MAITLTDLPGVGPSTADTLIENNIDSVKKLAKISFKKLSRIPGIGEVTGRNMIQGAKDLIAASKADKKDKKKGKKDKKGAKNKKDKKGKNKKGKKSKK